MKLNEEALNKAISQFVDDIFEEENLQKSKGEEMKKEEKKDEKMKCSDEEEMKESEEEKEELEEEEEEEEEEKKKKGVKKSLSSVSDSKKEYETLNKSLSALTDQVTALAGIVNKISKAPATLRKSVKGIDFVRKSSSEDREEDFEEVRKEPNQFELSKAREKIAAVMFEDGVKKGLLSARDVAEWETCNSLKDSNTNAIVKKLVKSRMESGTF